MPKTYTNEGSLVQIGKYERNHVGLLKPSKYAKQATVIKKYIDEGFSVNRLRVKFINDGDWDLAKVLPKVYKQLTDFYNSELSLKMEAETKTMVDHKDLLQIDH